MTLLREPGAWSERAVANLLAEGQFGYQNIELPYGMSTGGTDRSPTARAIFPADMTGKSVLDIGSKFGYFCFEAARRGASRVVGVDVDPTVVRRAQLLAECLGLDVSFREMDIETEDVVDSFGSFDYVLCLNVLHHMKDPIALIGKMSEIAREKLILEVANFSRRDRKRAGISLYRSRVLGRTPVIFVTANGVSESTNTQHYFFSTSAVENILLHKKKVFAGVSILPSEHRKRFIAIADKRQIRNLVVVSGPTASGLSDFVASIESGAVPAVSETLGIGAGNWKFARADRLEDLDGSSIENLVLEYDFLRPMFRSAHVNGRDDALDVLGSADSVSFVTLWCPPDELRKNLARRKKSRWARVRRPHTSKRQQRILREYADPARVCGLYRGWMDFALRHPKSAAADRANHIIVSQRGGIEFFSIREWQEMVRPFERGPRVSPNPGA